jgi:hypothetical protein
MRGRAALLIAVLAFGCSPKRSERCEDVCQRESDCAEKLDDDSLTVNKGECVYECNELERAKGGPELVTKHIECVDDALDCRRVLACP